MNKSSDFGEGNLLLSGDLFKSNDAPKQPLQIAKAEGVKETHEKTHDQNSLLLGLIETGLNKPLPVVAESKESTEKPQYEKVEYRDAVTGYKVTVHVPEGKTFDPKADKVVYYCTGDGGSNNALQYGKAGQRMLDKLPGGFYAVVSGGALKGGGKYAKFDTQGKAWDSLQQGMKSTLGLKDDDKIETEIWGYSRGANALSRLLAADKVLPSRVVILDACRQPLGNIAKYVNRGGKVDLTYAIGSSVKAKDNFISGLRKTGIQFIQQSDGSLVSRDGRVKVFARFSGGHGAVLANYVKRLDNQDVGRSMLS